ncbi:hypothetical protein M378DRAFT_91264 [Amanita muscaria Koide BX008]|uniref:Uncharacterized protein n=1 Tax=Amanita muscaria (strain Koide BX008) TaxID=946122 RepID=A0A0C2W271_AMAMK|nr:hypothetical protein M378DRAFT_91264 [Amanita muscaria Koide BX008]
MGLPQSRLPNLSLSQDMIKAIREARIEDDIKDDDVLSNLHNPACSPPQLDPITRLSIDIFLALANGSQQMYSGVRLALARHDHNLLLLSYHVVKKMIQKLTSVAKVETEMCKNSCVAFTGPFSSVEECPNCQESRYHPTPPGSNKRVPVQRFYTFPLGPQLQALWRSPESAMRMRYRARKTRDIIGELERNDGQVTAYDDVFHGHDYLEAVIQGDITENDVACMFSLDGVQLYRDKESDCWFFIWVILNFSPDFRYKKFSILPAGFVPGPNKPANTESFLLPSLRHFSVLQKEGLKIWDGGSQTELISRPFFMFGTADTLGLPIISGLVGHSGSHGCRLYCGFRGRRKENASMYYAAALLPTDYTVENSSHPDFDVARISGPNSSKYARNLSSLMGARTKKDYQVLRLQTGIVKPSICLGLQPTSTLTIPNCFPLDLMHLASLNLPQHLLGIWHNTIKPCLPQELAHLGILSNDETWKSHGALVASMKPFLPSTFEHAPRNPAEKVNSGYKAWEFLVYFWVIGPAIFRIVMPHDLWTHFCKLVISICIIHQRNIVPEQLKHAHTMIIEWEKEFELVYYQRRADLLHLMRPCVHAILHMPMETVRCGPLNLVAQWALENTVGNLGREVHQPSNPFSNLSQRGLLRAQTIALKALVPEFNIALTLPNKSVQLGDNYVLLCARDRHPYNIPNTEAAADAVQRFLTSNAHPVSDAHSFQIRRWARLLLPNRQRARCLWKEEPKEKYKNFRNSRNVKVSPCYTLAMVLPYSEPHTAMLRESHGSLYVCERLNEHQMTVIDVKSIQSVVAMIPFPLRPEEANQGLENHFFMVEKPFHDLTADGIESIEEHLDESDGEDNS